MHIYPFVASIAIVAVTPAAGRASDPSLTVVQSFDNALIALMKSGARVGQRGRAAAIAPVLDRAFDLPLMTRLAVGPSWTTISADDQKALIAAFRRMTIAQYAGNFDSYSGQSFTIAPKVDARGGDRLVRTTLNDPHGSPVAIAYRLRHGKIIDVFYKNSISQIATRRSDFAGILRSGGAKALIGHLDALSAKAGG